MRGVYNLPANGNVCSRTNLSHSQPKGHSKTLHGLCEIKFFLKKDQDRRVSVNAGATTIHERDTQLLYGTSRPTVSEDGSCRASDTCALQGYVHMCMRSTLCSGDRHTTGIPTKSAENKQTNLGSYSIPTELMSLSHDSSHAITPYLGNKVICD